MLPTSGPIDQLTVSRPVPRNRPPPHSLAVDFRLSAMMCPCVWSFTAQFVENGVGMDSMEPLQFWHLPSVASLLSLLLASPSQPASRTDGRTASNFLAIVQFLFSLPPPPAFRPPLSPPPFLRTTLVYDTAKVSVLKCCCYGGASGLPPSPSPPPRLPAATLH